MKKDQKISTVADLKERLARSNVLVVADYRGLDVEKITTLRRSCRKRGASLKVVKNTLFKKAIPGTGYAGAESFFEGPTAVAFGHGDPVDVIKALAVFARENEKFQIKGGVVDGSVYSTKEILRIATLPGREVMLARMVGSLSSPMVRMVGSLGSPLRDLMGALRAIKRAKEAA